MTDGGAARPGTRHEITVEADTDVRLDSLVAQRLGLSRTQSATLIANAAVTVNEKREKASYKSQSGDRIVVEVPLPQGREVLSEDIPLSVAFEDEHIVVIDKAAGMVVHPAPGNWTGTLVNALKGRAGADVDDADDRAGLVHRLDKDTSGLLIVAKSDQAHRVLNAAIANRKVVRRYAALSWGHIDGDRLSIDAPIARDPRDRKRMAIVSSGRTAKTDFVRLARFASVDLLRAHLHTGRTHQIRVHLQSVGHPVVGDDTYGGGGGRKLVKLPSSRHFLHAAWLKFRHPATDVEMDLRSPLPPDLRVSLAAAAEDPSLETHPNPLEFFGFYFDDR